MNPLVQLGTGLNHSSHGGSGRSTRFRHLCLKAYTSCYENALRRVINHRKLADGRVNDQNAGVMYPHNAGELLARLHSAVLFTSLMAHV